MWYNSRRCFNLILTMSMFSPRGIRLWRASFEQQRATILSQLKSYPSYASISQQSEARLSNITQSLQQALGEHKLSIVVVGSFALGVATPHSDIDGVAFFTKSEWAQDPKALVLETLNHLGIKNNLRVFCPELIKAEPLENMDNATAINFLITGLYVTGEFNPMQIAQLIRRHRYLEPKIEGSLIRGLNYMEKSDPGKYIDRLDGHTTSSIERQ
ncbi:MAG: hypothetical protein UX85_C0004G0072 [Candidatus Beckwithbacteria bacterium GW2011_GWB1_47_15]|uniref:Polymerase nucleotidyl transferase domain-containing protein n=1 Tax=Candidatus Beckwithbacteria bacterium GW2011_GWB1_47_15 TaxID=1618371 RepID=A0A0G1UTW8_9BACT|nr:MAG: hypothetical protein UY43_C0001G0170 [Candidatus Beckwithbacteria bacterium GW2011_GWC1_49_16]KKU35475.1 MAG: hypothetical protein UX50_C0003G0072 [Candidatus Beckwithbacteria bacterium GW2011_GWA1_46_30]KKU61150.1 MAG: hypothetical protein UX85_C0004G0072 [Candidatus Beckwithbacteria bacterium GW2011_GWB1_47_15]KKU71989.1 MAG: hypothetical protein UX97_C0002G0072 [Candidatus Beckwithbacteria bacterium GW2011_GWA2_47_25]KKW03226.1 MAG: hypothetical protein UY37_C0006G0051 [Candidatus Be